MRLDPIVAEDLYSAAQRVVEKHGVPGQEEWRDLVKALAEAITNDHSKNRPMMVAIHEDIDRFNARNGAIGLKILLPHTAGGYGT